jgi:fructokinase
MPEEKCKVVGLGELLWDLFPGGKKLGGAPANFAYITTLLGDQGIPASRLGQDDLAKEALRRLAELGLATDFVQQDANYPTGTVKVEVDAAGQPRFEISESVAWDFLEWTPQWKTLANNVDAVCFGSLAQRSPQSLASIRSFVKATRPDAVRIFDVNLRQQFFEVEAIVQSMKLATLVKMNHEELPRIMHLLSLEHRAEESSARRLVELFNLKLICVTRGSGGSLLVSPKTAHSHDGFRVKVADTVGAGDAFTAALVHEYLRGASLGRMNEAANRIGAWVASEAGATPTIKEGELERVLGRIG